MMRASNDICSGKFSNQDDQDDDEGAFAYQNIRVNQISLKSLEKNAYTTLEPISENHQHQRHVSPFT